MHAGGLIGDHTTGSLVTVLRQEKPMTLWSTGSSTPCISAFKPVFWNSDAAPMFSDPELSMAYWLRREQLHRAVIAGKADVKAVRGRIHDLESEWLLSEERIMCANVPDATELAALSADADKQEQALIDEFYDENWRDIESTGRYARYWNRKNSRLGQSLHH